MRIGKDLDNRRLVIGGIAIIIVVVYMEALIMKKKVKQMKTYKYL